MLGRLLTSDLLDMILLLVAALLATTTFADCCVINLAFIGAQRSSPTGISSIVQTVLNQKRNPSPFSSPPLSSSASSSSWILFMSLQHNREEWTQSRPVNDKDNNKITSNDKQEEALWSQDAVDYEDNVERHVPATGISLSDEVDKALATQQQQFATDLVPVEQIPGLAQLVSSPVDPQVVAFEPVRYLVALERPSSPSSKISADKDKEKELEETTLSSGRESESRNIEDDVDDDDAPKQNATSGVSFAMVDIPPYSDELAARMKAFMTKWNGDKEQVANSLVAILVTSRDAIYVDEAPTQMYSLTHRADLLQQWKRAFPKAAFIMSRLETPRECRDKVRNLQRLDGNGPFAWNETTGTFDEMGKPLVLQEWDYGTAQSVLNGTTNPDEVLVSKPTSSQDSDHGGDPKDHQEESSDNDCYFNTQCVRAREEGRKILAVCTPGHSFGTLSYLFPDIGLCCSGYTIPVEDTRDDEDDEYSSSSGAGPALDVRGYITTSRAGLRQQMESARRLVTEYGDRFSTVLPSRGDPLMLSPSLSSSSDSSSSDNNRQTEERQASLMTLIDQYDQIGQIYEDLGII